MKNMIFTLLPKLPKYIVYSIITIFIVALLVVLCIWILNVYNGGKMVYEKWWNMEYWWFKSITINK